MKDGEVELGLRGWYKKSTGELLLGRRTPQWIVDRANAVVETVADVVEPEAVVEETPAEEVVAEVTETAAEPVVEEVKPKAKAKAKKVVADTPSAE
jgi:hypothetical protein